MIKITNIDEANKTIEFIVEGNITQRELKHTYSEIEGNAKAWGKVNFVEQFNEIKGIEPQAIWDDLKLYYKNKKYFHKAALVTDKKWISTLTLFLSPIIDVNVKVFKTREIEAARLWAGIE